MKDRTGELRELSGGHPNDDRFVWYVVRGRDVDPDAISEQTKAQPDECWRAGDIGPLTGRARPDSGWLLNSGLEKNAEFHDHVEALLARMRPAWTAFVEVGQQHQPDVEAEISELNVRLGFDIYIAARRVTHALAR